MQTLMSPIKNLRHECIYYSPNLNDLAPETTQVKSGKHGSTKWNIIDWELVIYFKLQAKSNDQAATTKALGA
jgi:hypothetical protein